MSDSPSAPDKETVDGPSSDGSQGNSWRTVARDYFRGKNREVDLYAGTAMFVGGILLGIVALVLGLYSFTQTMGSEAYWQFRELACVAILLAMPAFIASDTAIVSAGGRTRVVFAASLCLCAVAVGGFTQTYPDQWIASGAFTGAALTLTTYAVGLIGVTTVRGSVLISENPLLLSDSTNTGLEMSSSDLTDGNNKDLEKTQTGSGLGDPAASITEDIESSTETNAEDTAVDTQTGADRSELSKKNKKQDSSLQKARSQLDSGSPNQAVAITYFTVRDYLVNQLDVSFDSVQTPRELLELCSQEGFDDQTYASLRDLTEAFEQVVYSQESIEKGESEVVLAKGDMILSNSKPLNQNNQSPTD